MAPGITPALAIPTTKSGSKSRATLWARALQSSPNISHERSRYSPAWIRVLVSSGSGNGMRSSLVWELQGRKTAPPVPRG